MARQIVSCHHRNSKSSGQVIPARSMPPTTTLRRAYFHDIKSPVQVDIPRARAAAAKNIFVGSGLEAGEAGVGAGDFEASSLGASTFGPSASAGAEDAGFRGGRYRVPFLCNCER
jgi:hypothetical protein